MLNIRNPIVRELAEAAAKLTGELESQAGSPGPRKAGWSESAAIAPAGASPASSTRPPGSKATP